MTPERLAEIEGRVMMTSPGPWRLEVPSEMGYPQRIYDKKGGLIAECYLGPQYPLAEPEFIAAARTDVPELIVEIRALQAESARLAAERDAAVARAAAAEAALARAYEHAAFQAGVAQFATKKAWQRQMDLCRFDAATEGPRP